MSKHPGSAYPLETRKEKSETHTMSVLVDNEPGVLARVIGLFSGRGYNIDSLTVSETEHEAHLSRITIVTSGTPMVIEQIQHQLERLVPIHRVTDLTVEGNAIERELAMLKIAGKSATLKEAEKIAGEFEAEMVDRSPGHIIFELTGDKPTIEEFIAKLQPHGLVEVARTGLAAISRGGDRT
jgi:acetolactate synthase-1/3 small subunit